MDNHILQDLQDVPDVPEAFDVSSLDGWGDTFIYNGMRPIVIPPDNHPDFLIDLANNSYVFIDNYQDEHFNRMLRIQDNSPNGYMNLPPTIPIWDIRGGVTLNFL
eukprot:scaffold35698_cov63-Attheya_sp.AAC.3